MTRLLIAEDHTMARYGTKLLLKELLPNAEINLAINFEQLLQQLTQYSFDLLILDINIPGGDNLQMIDVVRLRQPSVKILIFSAYDEQVYAIRYLQAGVNGYIMKDATENAMKEAILTVLKKDIYISPNIKQKLLFNVPDKKADSNPLQALSNRETEVMQQLIKGATLSGIAQKLSLQTSTVNTYKTRIFEKLDVSNVIELLQKIQLYQNRPA
jgi:DNA-binding NarL/FixJ family response regulator